MDCVRDATTPIIRQIPGSGKGTGTVCVTLFSEESFPAIIAFAVDPEESRGRHKQKARCKHRYSNPVSHGKNQIHLNRPPEIEAWQNEKEYGQNSKGCPVVAFPM